MDVFILQCLSFQEAIYRRQTIWMPLLPEIEPSFPCQLRGRWLSGALRRPGAPWWSGSSPICINVYWFTRNEYHNGLQISHSQFPLVLLSHGKNEAEILSTVACKRRAQFGGFARVAKGKSNLLKECFLTQSPAKTCKLTINCESHSQFN